MVFWPWNVHFSGRSHPGRSSAAGFHGGEGPGDDAALLGRTESLYHADGGSAGRPSESQWLRGFRVGDGRIPLGIAETVGETVM